MIIKVDADSKIPLFGLDYLGILDRGTNVLEVKLSTICNLRCKYCFVSSGDYETDFEADPDYAIEWINRAISLKGGSDIEIHIACYGESLLYPSLLDLIKKLRTINEITTISLQTNGLLLNEDLIKKLDHAGCTRLNISLNSLDEMQCSELCGVQKYNLDHLMNMFDKVLESNMELLIAPVWFFGVNDKGIEDIIQLIKRYEEKGNKWPKIRLGIQNYLTYKTGRKIKRAIPREFSYFYKKLKDFEKKYDIKLKLGPNDFNIKKLTPIIPPVKENEYVHAIIRKEGRYHDEFIGVLEENTDWAIKILSKKPLKESERVEALVIRGNLTGNLITGLLM